MKRRAVLSGLVGSVGLAAPATLSAQENQRLTLGTDRPDDAALLAERVARTSGGRVTIEVTAVSAQDARSLRSAVSDGIYDSYLSSEANFAADAPLLDLFAAIPNGMAPNELEAWIYVGEGRAIWDAVNEPAGLKSFLVGDEGPKPLWSREPISTLASLAGPVASVGAGRRALDGMGVSTVDLAAVSADFDDVFAFEGLTVEQVAAAGLHRTFPHVSSPSAGQPNSAIALGVATDALSRLEDDAALLDRCAAAHNAELRVRAAYRTAQTFRGIASEIDPVADATEIWDAQAAAGEALLKEIEALGETETSAVEAYVLFLKNVAGWSDLGEASYFAGRKRALSTLPL